MAVAREFLDSDRVNFLIWRYLLEGNYRETAAKFQKEWHVKEPHREFAFARHVKGHALVSVINRGLVYYALERQSARNHLPQSAVAEAEALQVGVFGPLDVQQPPLQEEDEDNDAEGEEVEAIPRKRSLQLVPNESPSKRPRLSNGYENGLGTPGAVPVSVPVAAQPVAQSSAQAPGAPTTSGTDATPMEIDNQDNHAYPSPLEGERAPSPVPRTDGPEQGTQVDKVDELSTDTTFIRLNEDAPSLDSSPPVNNENAPILLQCEWNPKDASLLAAAGTDALARVWTIPRATAPEPGQDHVSPPSVELIEPETPRTTTVTALSWTSDGSSIAVATDSDSRAAIAVTSIDGGHLYNIDVAEALVLKLAWNPSNTALLSICPDKGGFNVNVYSSEGTKTLSYSVRGDDAGAMALDATWTSDTEFLICGGDVLLCLRCEATSIVQVRKFETKEDDSFTQVLFDWRSNLAATSSDKGTLDLWDESGQRRSISAHQGNITAMAWQPLPASQSAADDERLIATGGDDCAILIWNARMPESRAKCFLTMDSPIVRLAFTPDGAFIAGATSNQVLIWKVGSNAVPRASWSRPIHPGWLSPKANTDSDEEDEHCLSWDADGHKLAYGSNSRLAIINFSR